MLVLETFRVSGTTWRTSVKGTFQEDHSLLPSLQALTSNSINPTVPSLACPQHRVDKDILTSPRLYMPELPTAEM